MFPEKPPNFTTSKFLVKNSSIFNQNKTILLTYVSSCPFGQIIRCKMHMESSRKKKKKTLIAL